MVDAPYSRLDLGLIGFPLGHSFSAKWFAVKFATSGVEGTYTPFPIPKIEDLEEILRQNPSLRGFNVTIPYKQSIISKLNEISDDASDIGAVNVVKILRTSEGSSGLKGYNTDWLGFYNSLQPLLSEEMKKALILGTGGASKGIAFALRKLGIKSIFVTRKRDSDKKGMLTYEELNEDIIRDHLLIVNTTPLGMYPNVEDAPKIPYEALTPKHLCYDLVYNPENTLFIKKAEEMGARVKNGLEMLHLQAEYSWRIWTGQPLNE